MPFHQNYHTVVKLKSVSVKLRQHLGRWNEVKIGLADCIIGKIFLADNPLCLLEK